MTTSNSLSPAWRPVPRIRPLAIGLLERDNAYLVTEVCDDAGSVKGWRPLGGGIEFGETAKDAVRREFEEEIALDVTCQQLVAVLENIYEHEGHAGHEIVFVYAASPVDKSTPLEDRYKIVEGTMSASAVWKTFEAMQSEPGDIYPVGLADYLR
ncbi:MAG: NUDIX hydrolase [Woeseiaceae bacterium]